MNGINDARAHKGAGLSKEDCNKFFKETMKILKKTLSDISREEGVSQKVPLIQRLFVPVLKQQTSERGTETTKKLQAMATAIVTHVFQHKDKASSDQLHNMLLALNGDSKNYNPSGDSKCFLNRVLTEPMKVQLINYLSARAQVGGGGGGGGGGAAAAPAPAHVFQGAISPVPFQPKVLTPAETADGNDFVVKCNTVVDELEGQSGRLSDKLSKAWDVSCTAASWVGYHNQQDKDTIQPFVDTMITALSSGNPFDKAETINKIGPVVPRLRTVLGDRGDLPARVLLAAVDAVEAAVVAHLQYSIQSTKLGRGKTVESVLELSLIKIGLKSPKKVAEVGARVGAEVGIQAIPKQPPLLVYRSEPAFLGEFLDASIVNEDEDRVVASPAGPDARAVASDDDSDEQGATSEDEQPEVPYHEPAVAVPGSDNRYR